MTFDEAVFKDYLTYKQIPVEQYEEKKDTIRVAYGDNVDEKVEVKFKELLNLKRVQKRR